jgi:antiviral helicase SKI2
MSDFVRVVTDSEPVPEPPSSPALSTGFEPDRFQKFAIAAIEAGENVLVTAKTGSGKTFVGEYQIAKSIQRGGRIFYTTPVKSLSNQKFNDLKKLFPDTSVGIMTGDIKFRPDAQIIVMTTEILRNLLFKKGTSTESVGTTALLSLDGLDAVIFDEVHYINDVDRGHVWEETLILLPPAIKLILLSATLSSPFGFARWLGESKKVRVWLISTLWRAVPLQHCVLSNTGEQRMIYDSKEVFHGDVYARWLAERDGALLSHDKFKDKVRALKAADPAPAPSPTAAAGG